MVIGLLLLFIGLVGSIYTKDYMSDDWEYTYEPPFTEHEFSVLTLLSFFICLFIAGIVLLTLGIRKKNKENIIMSLNNTKPNVGMKNTCEKCGLNLSEGTKICPRCGSGAITINSKREKRFCGQCGAPVKEGSFCSKCGSKI